MSAAFNNDESITIRITYQNGEETMFKIKRSTKMGDVFAAYAARKGIERYSLKFLLHGEDIVDDETPQTLELHDNDQIDCVLLQVGMISTFTSNDRSNPLTNYLMMTDDERLSAEVPIAELKQKAKSVYAKPFVTFNYEENPEILHESQLAILCELLEIVWGMTTDINRDRVDMKLTLSPEQLVSLLAPLDSFLDDKYKSKHINGKFINIFRKVPDARTRTHYKIALRMTRGPTNSCINFHCDGGYATSTSQIPLNSTSEYEGGALCFFVSNQLLKVPRIPGCLVQHPPDVLHGVTSVVHGTRKSLFIVDKSNGLGEKGVVSLTADHVKAFLLRGSNSSANGKKRAGEEPTQSANKKAREEDTGRDKDDRKKPPEEPMNIKKEVIVKKEEYTADTDDEDEKKPSGDVKDDTNTVATGNKEDTTCLRKVEHIPQAESPTMSWKLLWEQMRTSGWNVTPRNYYLHPSATKMSNFRDCMEGIHYFTSEKAMKQYAIKHLGWKGDGGSYDSIRGLCYAAQVVLCIAVSLDQVLGPETNISMGTLKKYCTEATHYQVLDEYSLGNIHDLVKILMEKQLLVSGNRGQFNARSTNAKVKVKVQLDDVEIALEKSLLDGDGFYKSLVDYVSREVEYGNIQF